MIGHGGRGLAVRGRAGMAYTGAMHAALFANSAWLDDELTTFQRLTVGLIDEQVRLTRVLPTRVGSRGLGTSDSSLFGQKITWGESRADAIETMRRCLSSAKLEGIASTIGVHLAVLASPEFQSGRYDTRSIPGWE